ncbi:MAG: DUF3153 domain-containing protein [Oscillatoriaceae bacterium SKW80]|nr:DUF3153 domain-containing protein [Oscillatoriaceae bacterium SKYG93]MCX8119237.1 DUF3153 domain-containing protein [Oscillatoriaceae bacterium SKW80]MDW8454704.1 DUF3153 domain-containing protein [Oscillatoriaceae cyanobacterium SKYGB_i_bin93]HIK28514.1 DUF3153 domain-containing protein [Oscillatoriaceae cyanobacterium M7585_C2015_266]
MGIGKQRENFFSFLRQSRILLVGLFVWLLLSGCVKYDVEINFQSQTHGEFVQHIKLAETLTSFSGSSVQEWWQNIERRARQLGGRVNRLSPQELIVTIPFNNGHELEEKFNQFFNPPENKNPRSREESELALSDIKSHLSITQNNLLLALRNHLIYELDMRALAILSSQGNVLVSPGSLIDLEFRLNTPWGARIIETNLDANAPDILDNGRQIVCSLKPAHLNHIEVIFWVPSPIGIGTLVIILFVAAGSFLKYQLFPALGIGTRQQKTVKSSPSDTAAPPLEKIS